VILPFSGEILKDKINESAIAIDTVHALCQDFKILHETGFEMGIGFGGGDIFRGAAENERFRYDRVTGDHIGMLAIRMNSIAMADYPKKIGVGAEVFSALPMLNICETYYPRHAQNSMENGKAVSLGGGTGSAFFSTDSAAALRANELQADVIVKATKVNSVYDKDPKVYNDAMKFDQISFQEVLLRRLKVMDSTAFSLCMDNNILIIIVDAKSDLKNTSRVLEGETIGTRISNSQIFKLFKNAYKFGNRETKSRSGCSWITHIDEI
jgi:uridylate kinase